MLNAPLDHLVPHQGMSSDYQWRRQPPDLESSCGYISHRQQATVGGAPDQRLKWGGGTTTPYLMGSYDHSNEALGSTGGDFLHQLSSY
jgi:hypothetical protein